MRILVGLGNPGARYAGHRHNIGFMALDEIARRHGFGPWRARFQSQAAEGRIAGQKCLALKPQTYMNESGRAVGEAMRFFKLQPADVCVFHDELDLRPGKMKVKQGGGAAGHNGLRSIISHIGEDFWRVRLGIGHPGSKELVHGYVLSDFAKAERQELPPFLEAVAAEVGHLIDGDPGAYMSRVAYLTQPPKPPAAETGQDSGAPEKD
ncbi:MAG: aminoacyl-tRNA hydrolase [Rhodovibrionaceae bacterium]|nr:aminoacyl-tRNA hydrolase [Rhodovibrionaceae bacterium]